MNRKFKYLICCVGAEVISMTYRRIVEEIRSEEEIDEPIRLARDAGFIILDLSDVFKNMTLNLYG